MMGLIEEINIIQLIISTVLAILAAIISSLITFKLRFKEYRRNFIIDKTYEVHKRLRDKLKDYFSNPEVKYDFNNYQRDNKMKLKKLKSEVKMRFNDWKKIKWHEVELYLDCIELFEHKFLKDISEIAKLSNSRIKRVASKIEKIYYEFKKEECLFNIRRMWACPNALPS